MGKLFKKSKDLNTPPGTLTYQGDSKSGKVKITVFDYDESHCTETELDSVEKCFTYKDKPTVTWINVDGLSRIDVLEKLSDYYLLHHLVLEDILNVNQRPKAEDFGSYFYIVSKMISMDAGKDEINEEQVSILLGSNFVITFQEEKEGDVFEEIRQRIRKGQGRIRKMGADYLVYRLLDSIVDNYFVVLEKIGEKIETIEESLLVDPNADTIHTINHLKRNLIFLRKSVWPLREVIRTVTQTDSSLMHEQSLVYFRDIHDHAIQAVDTIEAFRDTVSSMLDVYLSSMNHRLNEVMKVLTIIATIFMPLTFITGLYGMNFNTHVSIYNMPELNWAYGYPMVLGIIFLVVLGMLYYFKKRKWI